MSILTITRKKWLDYTTITGTQQSPTLVFLHEGLGCSAMWKGFCELLCRKTGCPGLVYDRLGYGKSAPLDSVRTIHYLHDYALNELQTVIELLLPSTPYILVGHSDGGSISLIHGAEKPQYLKGIIAEATHVFVEPETLQGIEKADKAYDEGKLGVLGQYHGEKTHTIFKAWSETWLSSWFTHWNIEYLLPSIECPLLVIQGNEDQYGTPRQVESIVSKVRGHKEFLLVENCGHSPHLEQPDIVLTAMSTFIERL